MNCKSFEEIFNEMGNIVYIHKDNIEISAIVSPSGKDVIGKYGWKLSYLEKGAKVEEEFTVEIESLKKNNGVEELDTMSNFLLDPSSFLNLLKYVINKPREQSNITVSAEDCDQKEFTRKELLFLARIDHLKTIKTKE